MAPRRCAGVIRVSGKKAEILLNMIRGIIHAQKDWLVLMLLSKKIPICLWSFMGKAAGRRACSEKILPRHVPMMSRAISRSCPADAVPGMSWLCDRMVCDCNKGCVLLGG